MWKVKAIGRMVIAMIIMLAIIESITGKWFQQFLFKDKYNNNLTILA